MIFRGIERDKKALVMAEGLVVTVQITDCGESNGETMCTAQMIADTSGDRAARGRGDLLSLLVNPWLVGFAKSTLLYFEFYFFIMNKITDIC